MSDLTPRQLDNEAFINVYKDVHGRKPRGHYFFDGTDEEREAAWRQLEADRDYEQALIVDEAHEMALMVEELLTMGAPNIETAIRWMS